MTVLADFLRSLAGTFGKDRDPSIYQAFDLAVPFIKAAADGMASTATADTCFFTNPFDFNLVVIGGLIDATGAGVTADASNNATITIKTDNGAGGATAVALQAITSIADLGTLTQNVPKAFTTVTAANTILAPKASLYFNIAKGGTGVVVPASSYSVRLRRSEA